IFLADVSGHGVASALLAGRIKAFFDENFRRTHRPRLFLEQLNQVLIDLGEHYHIATAVCLHIDVVETTMVYANAGHRTLYWLDTESDKYTLLPATGPALGMFDEFDITEVTHGFLPGRNRLVSYTDGLVEFKTRSDGWTTEDDFRKELLLPKRSMPLTEYFEELLEGSRQRTRSGEWDDDVSLLITDF
ncbi:MAG TPA: serine/threonine-protein phosphatase, partial [Firmicutes bacterium]|nr:serine/threonine-protein phosphatase [Bacillota bacterium]